MAKSARAAAIVLALLAARAAAADDGLVATVAVPGAPTDLRTVRFDVTLTNTSAAPIVLSAWKDASWRLTIAGPDHIAGGCVQPAADEPPAPIALAPHAAHAFHFRCATRLPALLPAGTYQLQLFYGNEKEPSWLLTQDRTHYYFGMAVGTAQLVVGGPVAAPAIEPALADIPQQVERGGCTLSLASVTITRTYIRSGVAPPVNRPPPSWNRLAAQLHVRAAGAAPCRFVDWQLELVDPRGARVTLRSLGASMVGGPPVLWDGEVAAHQTRTITLGGTADLDQPTGTLLTPVLGLSDRAGRFWLQAAPAPIIEPPPSPRQGPPPP